MLYILNLFQISNSPLLLTYDHVYDAQKGRKKKNATKKIFFFFFHTFINYLNSFLFLIRHNEQYR